MFICMADRAVACLYLPSGRHPYHYLEAAGSHCHHSLDSHWWPWRARWRPRSHWPAAAVFLHSDLAVVPCSIDETCPCTWAPGRPRQRSWFHYLETRNSNADWYSLGNWKQLTLNCSSSGHCLPGQMFSNGASRDEAVGSGCPGPSRDCPCELECACSSRTNSWSHWYCSCSYSVLFDCWSARQLSAFSDWRCFLSAACWRRLSATTMSYSSISYADWAGVGSNSRSSFHYYSALFSALSCPSSAPNR